MLDKENITFSNWKKSRYADIRGLVNNKKVDFYANNLDRDIHRWDISEIAAEDYVQLFGSDLARNWTDYKDVKERLDEDIKDYRFSNISFNLLPQENLDIPLAADVEGLYNYWWQLAFNNEPEKQPIPLNTDLTIVDKQIILKEYKQYKIYWTPVVGATKYTLVIYPNSNNRFPEPVKTISNIENTYALLGSGIKYLNDGSANIIYKEFKGRYVLNLFCQDENGFIHSASKKEVDLN